MKGRTRPASSFHIKSPLRESTAEGADESAATEIPKVTVVAAATAGIADSSDAAAAALPLPQAPKPPASGSKPTLSIQGATAAAESSTDGAVAQSVAVAAIAEVLLDDTCDTGEDTGEDTDEKKKKKKGGLHKLKKMRKGLFGKKSSSKEAA